MSAAECIDCGEEATTTGKDATGPYTYVVVDLCASCVEKRDNYEPPDPDGEAFMGGEAAAYQSELMDAARRLK